MQCPWWAARCKSPVVSERIWKDDIVIVRWHLGQHFPIQYSGEFGARNTAPVAGKRYPTPRASGVDCFLVFRPYWAQRDGLGWFKPTDSGKQTKVLCFRHSTLVTGNVLYLSVNLRCTTTVPKEKAYESVRKHQPYSNRGCLRVLGGKLTRIPNLKCCTKCDTNEQSQVRS